MRIAYSVARDGSLDSESLSEVARDRKSFVWTSGPGRRWQSKRFVELLVEDVRAAGETEARIVEIWS